jgi:hypothetical protein
MTSAQHQRSLFNACACICLRFPYSHSLATAGTDVKLTVNACAMATIGKGETIVLLSASNGYFHMKLCPVMCNVCHPCTLNFIFRNDAA